ncbi:Amino acid ABC transporter, periplasmic amino acid-binding protein [Photobacterium marinum]|uniref:Amino acid ABC transporter, periplasmic amino acid-binding protein n=1 Tax=Photobacterium marinum TaxID=1056511 RepID=L8JEW8_9GAMM|nr:transporter substrate-binding domain-containing protein [Photobacterium marinum]ELR66074.1 Amino acid ABC transporter, periplasmic amino acid-binding protein [Photobacterium marinum]
MKRLLATCLALLSLVMGSSAIAGDTTALTAIKERGTLRVGLSTFVPWAMRDKQGELIGFEVDVARRLADDAGLKVEFIPTAWDGIIPALLANKFDVIIGGMTITERRKKSVLFSIPYSHSGIQLAANKKLAKDLTTIESYNSRRVKIAVRRGATTATLAKKLFPRAKIYQFDDDNMAFQEVLNGNAHAVIASTPKPEHETLRHSYLLYMPFKDPLANGDEGFVMRLGDDELKAYFDGWIAARTNDGFLQERYDYWFKTLEWEDIVADY